MVGRGGGTEADSFWFKYALSATAATVAETVASIMVRGTEQSVGEPTTIYSELELFHAVTYPLDLTKTRLQIQGEKGLSGTAAVPYRGMIRTATGIVHEEGLLQLWQGVTPALYRHIVYTGSRMTVYEIIREKVLGKNPDGTIAVWKAVVGGICAGAIGQLIASPTDLVKVQMQMDGVRRLRGKKPRFKNTAHAFRKIVHHGGIRGLWSGVVPNVQRAALVNMGDMATYDTVKHQLLLHTHLTDNYVTHTVSSACSGVVAAVLGTPADVVKTRIMNQKRKHGKGVVYKSSLDCLMKTVNQEGFWALYKGFLPIWARMAPWSLTFWLTYEQVRKMTGASSF